MLKASLCYLLSTMILIPSAFARVELLLPRAKDRRVVYETETSGGITYEKIFLVSNQTCTGNSWSKQCIHGYSTNWVSYNEDAGTYRGCGRHASNHFIQWYKKNPPMQNVRHYVPGTEVHLPWPFDNSIFTTPAQLSVGLEKLLKAYPPEGYIANEIDTIRLNKGSKNSLMEQFIHYLKRGTPVIALVDGGNHWITVTGMQYTKDSNGTYSDIYFFIRNNGTKVNGKNQTWTYADMEMRNWGWWDTTTGAIVEQLGYTSLQESTIVSLKTDKNISHADWTPGWVGHIYNIKKDTSSTPYLLLFKPDTGTVNIRAIRNDGSIGVLLQEYSWSKGWSHMKSFSVGTHNYMFLLKVSTGEVHIHKMDNTTGKFGSEVAHYDWTGGWNTVEFFHLAGKTYGLFKKSANNLTHIREMNNNGSVGKLIMETRAGFMEKITNIAIRSDEQNKRVHFYGVNTYTGKYYHYTHTLETNKNFTLVQSRQWSQQWNQITVGATTYNSCFYIGKGTSELGPNPFMAPRNGLVHIHHIKNNEVAELVDTNYFKNQLGKGIPTKGWSNSQYFRAPNGQLRLFLLDRYSGLVRIKEMDSSCGFSGRSVLYKVLEQ